MKDVIVVRLVNGRFGHSIAVPIRGFSSQPESAPTRRRSVHRVNREAYRSIKERCGFEHRWCRTCTPHDLQPTMLLMLLACQASSTGEVGRSLPKATGQIQLCVNHHGGAFRQLPLSRPDQCLQIPSREFRCLLLSHPSPLLVRPTSHYCIVLGTLISQASSLGHTVTAG